MPAPGGKPGGGDPRRPARGRRIPSGAGGGARGTAAGAKNPKLPGEALRRKAEDPDEGRKRRTSVGEEGGCLGSDAVNGIEPVKYIARFDEDGERIGPEDLEFGQREFTGIDEFGNRFEPFSSMEEFVACRDRFRAYVAEHGGSGEYLDVRTKLNEYHDARNAFVEKHKTLLRGTAVAELKNLLKNGLLGEGSPSNYGPHGIYGDGKGADFVPTTTSPSVAHTYALGELNKRGAGVILELDTEGLEQGSGYEALRYEQRADWFVQTGVRDGKEIGFRPEETFKGSHTASYRMESEVRVKMRSKVGLRSVVFLGEPEEGADHWKKTLEPLGIRAVFVPSKEDYEDEDAVANEWIGQGSNGPRRPPGAWQTRLGP